MNKLLDVKKYINKRQRRSSFPSNVLNFCKKNKILIIYGESDDLLELRGYIDDEVGAYNGISYLNIDENNSFYDIFNKLKLELTWIEDIDQEISWKVNIDSNHEYEEFILMDDDEEFSIGLIIQL